jgi:outer membrane scaffolding protein for murein synthesis (MipA/OmpV family)
VHLALADPRQDLALEIEARQDVANGNGFPETIRGLYSAQLTPSWRLDTALESTWGSDDYMSAYFGIDARGLGARSRPRSLACGAGTAHGWPSEAGIVLHPPASSQAANRRVLSRFYVVP